MKFLSMKLKPVLKNWLLWITNLFFILAVLFCIHSISSYSNKKEKLKTHEIQENILLIKDKPNYSAVGNKFNLHMAITKPISKNNHVLTAADALTLALVMSALATLTYQAHGNKKDAEEKKSKFYLRQIQKYLQDSMWIIAGNGQKNINIRWHQAINSFEAIEILQEKLTEKPHIEIYLTDYLNTAYSLINIITSIDSYKFFFGVNEYKDKSDDDLEKECQGLELFTSKISPNSLYVLACFIDRASRISEDMKTNNTPILDCRNKAYFKKLDKNYGMITPLAGVNNILKYIEVCKRLDS